MTALELSRLQFAVVTVYHYLFVPLSISLAALTAGLQTAWRRTGHERWRSLSLLVGKLLMATFAVGVVTGLVQELQFGLSWSAFARFYGDVFGPTLAIEGMLAFFLEATFLGLWWFGWDRLGPRLHLATIWVVAVGTLISAYVILAANAFMQHPVAYSLDPATGRARLGSFADLMTNEVVLAAFPHTVAGAFAGGGSLLLAIGAWRAWGSQRSRAADPERRQLGSVGRGSRESRDTDTERLQRDSADTGGWRALACVGAWTTTISGAAVALTGDHLGKVMTSVQPMKMAAAEALYSTRTSAPFSLFAVGAPGSHEPAFSLDVPWLLSFLATGTFTGRVQGVDDLQARYVHQFGPGDYVPVVPVAYWSFRVMIGLGVLSMLVGAWVLWRTRRGRDLGGARIDRWLLRGLPAIPLLPAAAGTVGWLFTETARQPWLVFGLFRTADGVSPGLTPSEIVVSLAGFALVYGLLAVVWVRLVLRVARTELTPAPADDDRQDDRTPVATY